MGLKSDGTVVAVGYYYGQRNTNCWRDIGIVNKNQLLKEQQPRTEQSKHWTEQGKCRYCGGDIGGLFIKKCKDCGKVK
jgi:hypothetical protein